MHGTRRKTDNSIMAGMTIKAAKAKDEEAAGAAKRAGRYYHEAARS